MTESDKSVTVPSLGTEFPKGDARETFDTITARTPLPDGAESAFVASRLQLLRTHPVALGTRRHMVESYLDSVRSRVPVIETRPTPGGVGYGMFYTPEFKAAFQT